MVRNSGAIPRFRIAPSSDLESKSINSICRILNAVTHFPGVTSTSLILFDQNESRMPAFCLPRVSDQITVMIRLVLVISQKMRVMTKMRSKD